MAKISFTFGRIRDFQCPPEKHQAFLWDAVTQGLGLRATSGSKSYIFQGKLKGQVIRIKIGGLDTYSIEEAREQARTLKKIIDSGRDPRQVKEETTAADIEKRKQNEINQIPALVAWDAYIKARTSKWSQRHKADHEAMARLGGERISRGKRAGMPDTKQEGIFASPADITSLADYSQHGFCVARARDSQTPHPRQTRHLSIRNISYVVQR